MKKQRITIINTFHNTSISILVEPGAIKMSEYQVKRAERELCGMQCSCGMMWGSNHTYVHGYEGSHFEPIVDRRTGLTVGAELVQNMGERR